MKVVIYGVGKQAELTHYFFTHDSPHEVAAFCVERKYLTANTAHYTLLGLPIVAFEEVAQFYPPTQYRLHIAVGQITARKRLYEAAKLQGWSFASYIASRAHVWPDLVVGEHVYIDDFCFVHPYVTVGDNTMLMGVTVGHHTQIGSHVLLSVATIGGGSTIGDATFIGMGSIVNEGVTVGANNIIGSGCLIHRNTVDNAIYSGVSTKPRAVDATRFTLFKK